MASIQERLQIKREPLDKWSVREQLCLASAVARSGDQNWMSVSRALKPFGDSNRPSDWFHQKNCAAQYGALLENVETPKRKKRASGQDIMETPADSILRRLTAERKAELKKLMTEGKAEYAKLQEEMALLRSGTVTEEQLDKWCKEIDEEEKQKEQEAHEHAQRLKERELRKQEIERAWRPMLSMKVQQQINQGQKRKASDSIDSIMEIESLEETQQSQVVQEQPKPPISPLLTSLLKSPSHVQTISANTSILHSAITSQRISTSNSNPTITSLLNSSANITVSPGLQQLVSSAIGQEPMGHDPAASILQSAADILDDATDPLPNLKVEDIESTILNSDDPLPEIKNEEVEVIISDLIENADIVTDPEQHLQLDDNDDIISNLDELVNEENAAKEEEARVEQARLEALAKAEQERLERERQELLRKEQLRQEQIRQEQLRLEQERNEKARLERIKMEEAKLEQIKAEQAIAEKAQAKIDPFEFEEDPVIYQRKPSSSLVKSHDNQKDQYEQFEQKRDQEVQLLDEKEIKKEVMEENIKNASGSGSVEIVEVVVLEEEELGKELNKSQIESIVHSSCDHKRSDSENKTNLSDTCGLELKQEKKEEKIENQELDLDDQTDSLELDLTQNVDKKEGINLEQRRTFTPEYSDDIFDDINIEVTKNDKVGKVKRDYSRKTKKEEKDLEMFLAAEQTENTESEDTGETYSEKDFSDKKHDVKAKTVKNDADRSNSPWTEEEEVSSSRNRRRYSTPATPIDSIPNSPASGIATDDDREYRNWKKSVMLVYSRLATHKYASLFLKPITDDQAPGYHSIVYRPMDLQTIRKNVENGVIRTTAEFQRDVLLMFNNAIMYNRKSDHVYNMAKQMQQESIQQIQILLQARGDLPVRRETRTSEPGSKRKRLPEETNRTKKRKDD